MNKTIVFVYNNCNRGGAQKMILWVAGMCVGKFDEVYFVTFHKPTNNMIDIPKGVIHRNLDVKKNIISSLFSNSIYRNKLSDVLHQINPSIVCAFGYNAINICYRARHGNNYSLVGSERNSATQLSFFRRINSIKIYKKCDAFVFQTIGAREFYGNNKNFFVIPNPYLGVGTKEFISHKDRKKVIFCAAARFDFLKGFDVAIKAFNIIHHSFNDYKLVIFANGSNKYRKRCNRIIKNNNLQKFVDIYETINDVAFTMKDSMVFLLPSRAEGIPNILLEVMGLGIPAVACDCPPGGPKMLTDNGKRGLLVPINDYRSLAYSAMNIIRNPLLSDTISREELKVIDEYAPENIFEKWASVFDSLPIR